MINGIEVHGGILADSRMRTTTGFNTENAIFRQRFVPQQEFRILFGIDIVGDYSEIKSLS